MCPNLGLDGNKNVKLDLSKIISIEHMPRKFNLIMNSFYNGIIIYIFINIFMTIKTLLDQTEFVSKSSVQ